jgi:hypothetical protein
MNKLRPATSRTAIRVLGKPATSSRSPRRAKLPTSLITIPPPEAGENHVTQICARIDVGFGNALFIRGQGGGLNWDRGVILECIAPSLWRWSAPAGSATIVFKLLLNDVLWAAGDDLRVAGGNHLEVTPYF